MAVFACYVAALGYGAAQSPGADSEAVVFPFLEAHHLTSGLGQYPEAAWYDPRQSYANFVLTNSADTYGMGGGGPGVPASMISRSAIAALHAGPPARVPLQDVHHPGLEPQSATRPDRQAGRPFRRAL